MQSARMMKGTAYWSSVVVLFGAFTWGAVAVSDLQEDFDQATRDRDALSDQVRGLGGTPVAGPQGERGTDGRNGLNGDAGPVGPQGSPGPTGASGRPGSDGDDGQDGTDGQDGADGPQGDTGPVGPAGPQGPTGPQGPQGEQGEQGPEGRAWRQGSPGVITCAEGYSAVDINLPGDDGNYRVCRRDE